MINSLDYTGIDAYQIVSENPEYPSRVTIFHRENVTALENSLKSPQRKALSADTETWVNRRVIHNIWGTSFELVCGFRGSELAAKPTTLIENAPIMHLEGYRLVQEDQGKYARWLEDYGFNSFIPLIMRLHGLIGYDCYRNTGIRGLASRREWEYPDYLSIIYFNDFESFDKYKRSPEVLSFQKAISTVFPNGLNIEWYVLYQLLQSWRK